MYLSGELFQCSRKGYFCVYFLSCEATREINQNNNTRVSTETVCQESTYIILFLTWNDKSINENKMTIFTHCPRVSLTQTSFCWWRHNPRLMTSQYRDNCDAITWMVISKSLDNSFIQGNIHRWSCKKLRLLQLLWLCKNKYKSCYDTIS